MEIDVVQHLNEVATHRSRETRTGFRAAADFIPVRPFKEGSSRLLIGGLHLSPSGRNTQENNLGFGVDVIKRRVVDRERTARIQPKLIALENALAVSVALRSALMQSANRSKSSAPVNMETLRDAPAVQEVCPNFDEGTIRHVPFAIHSLTALVDAARSGRS